MDGGDVEKTGVTARREEAPGAIPPAVAAAVAALSGLAATWLFARGTPATISGAVLAAVVGLAAIAVVLGAEAYGADVEGPLGLSTRLGLGLLGGFLGALVSAAAEWLLGGLGITLALGVEITGRFSAAALGQHVLGGAVWGLIFGAALPVLPGGTVLRRALIFVPVPALWMLLKVFPVDRGVGALGVELGALTFLFVLLFWWLWALTAGWLMAWGARTTSGPLDRPLGY